MLRYGYYKENGKLKYRLIPKELLKKKRKKKKMNDYCKLDTSNYCHCLQEDVIQAVEYEDLEDEDAD